MCNASAPTKGFLTKQTCPHLVVLVWADGDKGHVVETVEVLSEVVQARHEAKLALRGRKSERRAAAAVASGHFVS